MIIESDCGIIWIFAVNIISRSYNRKVSRIL